MVSASGAAVAVCALLVARCTDAAVLSITLQQPADSAAQQFSVLRVDYAIAVDDAFNGTKALLYPYWDGAQYGAEVGVLTRLNTSTSTGHAYIPLPTTLVGAVLLQLACHAPPQGPTVGRPAPPDAVWSNGVSVSITPRTPTRPRWAGAGGGEGGAPLLSMYYETWFTPLNFFWQGGTGTGGEAIPLLGRYASVDVPSIIQHAAWLVQSGVDVLAVDWTNNAWDTPTWADRHPNVQEIVNATALHMGVYAGLRAQGWPVPRFLLLLGLDNGPSTPLPALQGQLDYIVEAVLANATLGPSTFPAYLGRPLVTIFDGAGKGSGFTHPNFTIRWVSSQNQGSGLNNKGYWSWMDGVVEPTLTPFNGRAEAATVAPAFFAGGGWTHAASAMGRSGGLTYVQEVASVLQQTVGRRVAPPTFLFTCQWNEFAGQPQGSPSYTDSYSADLSNDMEPTGPYGCGYARPGVACGGTGYRPMNILAMMSASAHAPSHLDAALMLSILTPTVGAFSNYTAEGGDAITITWVVTAFNSTALGLGGAYAVNVSVPVQLSLDGVVLGVVPTPLPGPGSVSVHVSSAGPGGAPLDRAVPHILTLTAQGDGGLTTFPLSFDAPDEGVPLAVPVPATAVAWIRLPESA